MTVPGGILRIIDANLNRMGEGLRVLEELARLSLNDVSLTQQLKNMRHDILRINSELQQQLLQARDSAGDVGAGLCANSLESTRPPWFRQDLEYLKLLELAGIGGF